MADFIEFLQGDYKVRKRMSFKNERKYLGNALENVLSIFLVQIRLLMEECGGGGEQSNTFRILCC